MIPNLNPFLLPQSFREWRRDFWTRSPCCVGDAIQISPPGPWDDLPNKWQSQDSDFSDATLILMKGWAYLKKEWVAIVEEQIEGTGSCFGASEWGSSCCSTKDCAH